MCKAGKQYKKGGYKTLLEAQLDFHNVVFEVSSDIKFASLVNLFLTRHCPLNCKQSTIDLYDRMIESRFQQFMNKEARNITPKEVENLIFSLKATGQQQCTKPTASHQHSTKKHILIIKPTKRKEKEYNKDYIGIHNYIPQ